MGKPSAILMGSKPGSVVALEMMLERGWDVKAVVVAQKDAHPWIAGPTLADRARSSGVPVTTQAELSRSTSVDFVISYMYRNRVKPDVTGMARRAALNFHAGPLPEFGGWAFYSVAILEDAVEYGCTCHYMDEGFDSGPLLKVQRFSIDASRETAYSLERKAQAEMVRLFADFCDLAESGRDLPCAKQDAARMRYMRREEFEALKRIPPGADAKVVERYARAFWYPPYECAVMRTAGCDVEVVPQLAKEELALMMHANDLADLRAVAAEMCLRTSK